MEPRAAAAGSPEPAAASPSFQAQLWKNLQLEPEEVRLRQSSCCCSN